MKKLFSLAALATAALLLAACSGSPEAATQTAPVSSTASASPQATAKPAVSAQPATAAPSTSAAPSSAAAPTVVPTVGPTAPVPAPSPAEQVSPGPEPAATPLADLGLNARGNVAQKVGETSVFGAATGQQFADLTADSIQADFKCTGPDAQPSINGQFVAITISVAAQDNFADSGWPSLALSNMEFTAWDAAGEQLVDPIGNSAGCVPAEDLIESPVEPGTKVDGLVILDVPKGAGSAAFVVGGFEGSYGWEWHW